MGRDKEQVDKSGGAEAVCYTRHHKPPRCGTYYRDPTAAAAPPIRQQRCQLKPTWRRHPADAQLAGHIAEFILLCGAPHPPQKRLAAIQRKAHHKGMLR